MANFLKIDRCNMLGLIGFFLFMEKVAATPLMLSPAELEAIGAGAQVNEAAGAGVDDKNNLGKVRLDGILFQEENKWYVWLNGQRFSSQNLPVNYKIIKVYYDKIEIVAIDETEERQPITLTLGQSY